MSREAMSWGFGRELSCMEGRVLPQTCFRCSLCAPHDLSFPRGVGYIQQFIAERSRDLKSPSRAQAEETEGIAYNTREEDEQENNK